MSSLAATQADGYYVPVEYYEGGAYKKQSKNQFHATQSKNTTTGNNKTKKGGHNQWLQNGVVRFELPHQGHCLGPHCPQIAIGQGTRYNAKKIKTDQSYFSTPIVEFQLQCRACQQPWIIRTNPGARGFDYVSGIKKQAEAVEDGVVDVNRKLERWDGDHHINDPLARLETAGQGKKRALTEIEELQQLVRRNDATSGSINDADNNAKIRRGFRHDRKDKRSRVADAAKLGWRSGIELLPLKAAPMEDIVLAKEVMYGARPTDEERKRMSTVRKSSIFQGSSARRYHCSMKRRKRRRDINGSTNGPDPVKSLPSLLSGNQKGASSIGAASTTAQHTATIVKPQKRKVKIIGAGFVRSTDDPADSVTGVGGSEVIGVPRVSTSCQETARGDEKRDNGSSRKSSRLCTT